MYVYTKCVTFKTTLHVITITWYLKNCHYFLDIFTFLWVCKKLDINKQWYSEVTFVDFKKTFDSVDRETIDEIIQESGVKSKLGNVIRETLMDTASKMKFMGEK